MSAREEFPQAVVRTSRTIGNYFRVFRGAGLEEGGPGEGLRAGNEFGKFITAGRNVGNVVARGRG